MSAVWTRSDGAYTYVVKNDLVLSSYGYDVYRSERKKEDMFGDPRGHARVYYDVYEGDWMLESFKSLDDAKAFILRLL